MLVLYADDYLLHVPKHEYYDGKKTPHAEQPDRIAHILEGCNRLDLEIKEVERLLPREVVAATHSEKYVDYIRNKCSEIRNEEQLMPSVFIKDTYTPLTRHTYEAALKSAALAVAGAEELQGGKDRIYALCRPPGHHAEHNSMGGYCYFNNAALAAENLSRSGKVAILDIDYHHGNGTQEIFYNRADVLYVSLHADPTAAFPYTTGFADERGEEEGAGANHNLLLPPETTPELYLEVLKKAVGIINNYKPDYLIVSLGFDTYESDPIGGLGLNEEAFKDIGQIIANKLRYKTLIVQEGGYSINKLDVLAENFLKGYLGR